MLHGIFAAQNLNHFMCLEFRTRNASEIFLSYCILDAYYRSSIFVHGLNVACNGGVYEQVVRLLATHPAFKVTMMTADRKAGQTLGSVFPHLITQVSLPNDSIDILKGLNALF